MRAGSVGIPIPGSSVRISDEGEVLVRGVGVSPGYLIQGHYRSYTDGFYRTGDVGRLDQTYFVYPGPAEEHHRDGEWQEHCPGTVGGRGRDRPDRL